MLLTVHDCLQCCFEVPVTCPGIRELTTSYFLEFVVDAPPYVFRFNSAVRSDEIYDCISPVPRLSKSPFSLQLTLPFSLTPSSCSLPPCVSFALLLLSWKNMLDDFMTEVSQVHSDNGAAM